ncbi:MAG: hypothetical protein R3B09_11335 [Nannocystaceae bacterium]
MIEVSGRVSPARLSAAASLVRRAQLEGETTAWIQPSTGGLFPPDLAAAGVDLEALVVIHAPIDRGVQALLQAAEWLLRSGAYGLVVVDLCGQRSPRGDAWQARLCALARQHQSRVVVITQSDDHEGSLGPLVGLRVAPRRSPPHVGLCRLDVQILKNKSGAPLTIRPESWRAPTGLEG